MKDRHGFEPPGENGKRKFSRRRFLEKSVCGVALVGTAVLPAWSSTGELLTEASSARRRGKISKARAQYQDRPRGRQQCSGCVHFQGPDSCEIVAGPISPNGWCRHFKSGGGRMRAVPSGSPPGRGY